MSYRPYNQAGYAVILKEDYFKRVEDAVNNEKITDEFIQELRDEDMTDAEEIRDYLEQDYCNDFAPPTCNPEDSFDCEYVFNKKQRYEEHYMDLCSWMETDNADPFKPDYDSEESIIRHAIQSLPYLPEGFDIRPCIVKYNQCIWG